MKTTAFTKKCYMINDIIPYRRWILLAEQIVEIETGKPLMKNSSKKWVGFVYPYFCFCCCYLFVSFS